MRTQDAFLFRKSDYSYRLPASTRPQIQQANKTQSAEPPRDDVTTRNRQGGFTVVRSYPEVDWWASLGRT
jgi:hypothetical protein